jgi:cytochrome c-type biogenesis protein CcmH
MKAWLIVAAILLALPAQAREIRQFDDAAKEQSYESLVRELRCLVCQNQSLADSDAELAKDLRDEVYKIIQSGKSEHEAAQFLVDRYGDFVLYRPPFKPITLLLWIGPFVLLVAGGSLLWRQAKRRSAHMDEPELTAEERQRLQQLRKKIEG